jgi:hypothetical protein
MRERMSHEIAARLCFGEKGQEIINALAIAAA